MRLPRSLFRLLALGLTAGLLVSCGDDDPTKPEGDEPPAIESPQLIDGVDFNSEDQTAKAAEALVGGMLTAAKAPAVVINSVLAPTASADWGGDGTCWVWTYKYGTCTTIYKVCPVEGGFDWTVVLGGTCGGQVHEDWVVLRGFTDVDGLAGTLRFYETNSTVVKTSVSWSRAADGNSGTWQFYDGEVASENLEVTMTWAETAPGAGQIAWEVVDELKWVINYSLDGDAGSMLFYDWDDAWVLTGEITWTAAGTGSWTTYDGQGGSTTQSW